MDDSGNWRPSYLACWWLAAKHALAGRLAAAIRQAPSSDGFSRRHPSSMVYGGLFCNPSAFCVKVLWSKPNRDRGRPHDLSPPTPPYIRVTYTAVRSLQYAPHAKALASGSPRQHNTRSGLLPCKRPVTSLCDRSGLRPARRATMPSADSSRGSGLITHSQPVSVARHFPGT